MEDNIKPRPLKKNKKIKHLRSELEEVDCIQNRIDLAKAYFQNSQFQDSIDVLEKGLTGIHSSDPHVLEGLCFSYFKIENYKKAKEYLSLLEKITEGPLENQLIIIKSRIYEALGNEKEALYHYKAILHTCTGEEARCRYALLLKKSGQISAAREVFEEILKNAKQYPKQYKKFQNEWVSIAKNEINA